MAMLSRAYLGKPVFFIQKRPGLGGKPFDLLKFRTMKNALDSKGLPLPDSEHSTVLSVEAYTIIATAY